MSFLKQMRLFLLHRLTHLVAKPSVPVLVEDGEDDVHHVVVQVHVGTHLKKHIYFEKKKLKTRPPNDDGMEFHLRDVLERLGVDGGAGEVVEVERLVHVLDVHQQVEDLDVVGQADAGVRLQKEQDKSVENSFKSCWAS